MKKLQSKILFRTLCMLAPALALCSADAFAQAASVAVPSAAPREAAPVDLAGTWISVVTEDWRWRMITPAKGDYASLPLTPEGRRVADTWDPDADKAAGNQCRAYGPGGIMRMPTRVKISWDDDNSLRIETDHGQQTRLVHFNAAELAGTGTLQGNSLAAWDDRSLKVVTRDMTAGYVRRNGIPYSDKAVVTEWFDQHVSFGEDWFTITTVVDDPLYFNQKFVVSSSFKKLADASSWNPQPCVSEWGPVKEGDRFKD